MTTESQPTKKRGLEREYDVKARFPDGYELIDAHTWAEVPQDVRDANARMAEAEKAKRDQADGAA